MYQREQLNLLIRRVGDNYLDHEDPIGLVCLPNTTVDTLFTVVRDILICCVLPIELCRGQAFDAAAHTPEMVWQL